MDFALKMMDFVLKMMNCALKMMDFVLKNDEFCQEIEKLVRFSIEMKIFNERNEDDSLIK